MPGWRLLKVLPLVLFAACGPGGHPSGASDGILIRFAFDNAPKEYQSGFTGFVVFEADGNLVLPLRHALTVRKGFMDRAYMEWQAQDTTFWVEPSVELTFKPRPKARALLIGHRQASERTGWRLHRILINAEKPDANALQLLTVPVGALQIDKSMASPEVTAAALSVLQSTQTQTDDILNKMR